MVKYQNPLPYLSEIPFLGCPSGPSSGIDFYFRGMLCIFPDFCLLDESRRSSDHIGQKKTTLECTAFVRLDSFGRSQHIIWRLEAFVRSRDLVLDSALMTAVLISPHSF